MKIVISYESETILPDELQKAFDTAYKRICENRFEPDKIHIDIEHLRRDVILFLAEHLISKTGNMRMVL